ncbi:hypothetical protein BHE74_00046324 [Ensete ventricosum]|nr:hypothetical protein GW17_00032905 [Ensete ventricosum]RWW47661.1 hypothetical protein BHE74_00046324 [Ensete ventricosum]RZR94174.1 hypothetical protein BHM03_00022816 [Ensete ventricosum]
MAGGSAIHSLPPPMTHRFHAVPSLPLASCFDLGSFSPYLEHTPSTFTPTPRLLPSLPLPDNAALGTFLTLASPSLPVSSARPFGSVPSIIPLPRAWNWSSSILDFRKRMPPLRRRCCRSLDSMGDVST